MQKTEITSDLLQMRFFYLKSVNFGPFRINLSKSGTGVGYRGSGYLVLLAAIPASLAFTD